MPPLSQFVDACTAAIYELPCRLIWLGSSCLISRWYLWLIDGPAPAWPTPKECHVWRAGVIGQVRLEPFAPGLDRVPLSAEMLLKTHTP